jgi:hypothetical protein
MINWDKVSKVKAVRKLIEARQSIECLINQLDKDALINYELQQSKETIEKPVKHKVSNKHDVWYQPCDCGHDPGRAVSEPIKLCCKCGTQLHPFLW